MTQDENGEVKRDAEGKTISQLQDQGIVKLAEAGLTNAKRVALPAEELAARLFAICQQRQQEMEEQKKPSKKSVRQSTTQKKAARPSSAQKKSACLHLTHLPNRVASRGPKCTSRNSSPSAATATATTAAAVSSASGLAAASAAAAMPAIPAAFAASSEVHAPCSAAASVAASTKSVAAPHETPPCIDAAAGGAPSFKFEQSQDLSASSQLPPQALPSTPAYRQAWEASLCTVLFSLFTLQALL